MPKLGKSCPEYYCPESYVKWKLQTLSDENKTEAEILEALSKITTQQMIADVMGIKLRRVKYLFQKYGIRKYETYDAWTNRVCLNCGELDHVSNYRWEKDGDRERISRFCSGKCKNEYYRLRYMKHILEQQWEQKDIIHEIFIREAEINALMDQLNMDGITLFKKLKEIDSPPQSIDPHQTVHENC